MSAPIARVLADDPRLAALVRGALHRLAAGGGDASWLLPRLAPYDVAGLDAPGRRNLHPVDLETLRQRSHLRGLTRPELEARVDRLRDLSDSHSSMYPPHP